jgi:hypothetical protein
MKIIFQDIDGPLIPMRMYYNGSRPHNGKSFIYDPVAVDMLRTLCRKFDAKVVFNTAHNENPVDVMMYQATTNGMEDIMYTQDPATSFDDLIVSRLYSIEQWLARHPEVTDWVVIDDYEIKTDRLVQVDFRTGMTIDTFYRVCDLLGEPSQLFTAINGVMYR